MLSVDALQTARLRLDRIVPGDLDDFARLYADPLVTATLGGILTRAQVAQYLDRQMAHWQQHGFGLWTMRELQTGRFIGRGGLRHATIDGRIEVEISYGLMAPYWGQGLATELARESVRVGFMELRRPDLVCFTLPTNFASRRVMEKAGFRYERDIIWADLPHVLCRQRLGDYLATR